MRRFLNNRISNYNNVGDKVDDFCEDCENRWLPFSRVWWDSTEKNIANIKRKDNGIFVIKKILSLINSISESIKDIYDRINVIEPPILSEKLIELENDYLEVGVTADDKQEDLNIAIYENYINLKNTKVDKPLIESTSDSLKIVALDNQGESVFIKSNELGKVKSVNNKIGDVILKTSDLENDSDYTTNATLTAHTSNKNNPHNVTKEQIGLGNVDNTSDLNKPISTATQIELNKKINKPITNNTPDYVLLANGSTAPKSDFGKVDKVMGVAPDVNKNVDISGVALNWTHANQRFSGLADRSSDATFNGIMGLDNSGNAAKITQSARLLEATLQGTTSEQALRIGNLLNGGNGSSGAISVNLIYPPLLQNTRNDIEYVLLRGSNLLLNNTDMSISICDEGKSVIQRIPNEQIINNSTTELLFYYNFYQFTTGTYYLKITSGVKIYFTTLDLQIVDEIENIDINAITWDINYKEGVIPKNTDNASGGYVSITTLKPVTELPIQSLKSSPLFSKDDDFYIEFTLELGPKWLHVSRYFYFSFIGLGDSSIPNTLFNNSFIYLKYSHSWDDSNAMYNNDSRISNFNTPSKIIVNVIKTKGICRMVIGSSNVNVRIPNMDYFSLFMAFTGNEYELLTQIKIIKAFKIK